MFADSELNIENDPDNHLVTSEYYAGTRTIPLNPLGSPCFPYLMMTMGMGTALGVASLLVII